MLYSYKPWERGEREREKWNIYMHVYIKVYKDNVLKILTKCFQYTHTYLFAIYTNEKRNFKCQHVILLFTEANSQTPSYPDVKIKKKKLTPLNRKKKFTWQMDGQTYI